MSGSSHVDSDSAYLDVPIGAWSPRLARSLAEPGYARQLPFDEWSEWLDDLGAYSKAVIGKVVGKPSARGAKLEENVRSAEKDAAATALLREFVSPAEKDAVATALLRGFVPQRSGYRTHYVGDGCRPPHPRRKP